ncbi:molecular chaperone TorD family protein [Slackia exigua]|uniref:molecular chaperone TorD family protein n=1 Tax=Slackia exigua TaxID=84109 RepID=UPI002005317A|nr:molecular chaperone TorD family protein [Slackia exigua]MCK6139966.1 molecular chaperone TorD family protein [Slackia exigua]
MATDSFIQTQQGRMALYNMVARLFERPLTRDDLEALTSANLADLDMGDERMAHGLKVMTNYLRRRNTGTHEVLNRDYTSAFYGIQNVDGRVAMPYESAFETENQLLMGPSRTKVFNIYKKQALKLDEGVDLPDDHLSFMCEFMSVMSDRAVQAYAAGNDEALRENLQLQRAFLKHHILNWYPKLEKLAGSIVEERFYRGVLEFAGAFFELDERVLKGLLSDVGGAHAKFDLAWWETPRPAARKHVYRPKLDTHRCIRKRGGTCIECFTACPVGIDPCADRGHGSKLECTRCGACEKACPAAALMVERAEDCVEG